MDVQYEVIIIGSGPAGMTAAIYASRAGLKTAMLEYSAPGGKLIKTNEIENYPGVKKANGADLAYQMYEHSINFGAEYLYGKVTDIIDGDVKTVVCEDGSTYTTKAIIVATGTVERKLNIPNEEEMTGKGVSYCAICDGAFFKDKIVTVIGGGNSALEESLYLANYASKVNIVIRRDVFRAEQNIQEQVSSNSKINVVTKHIPREIMVTDNKVSGIVLESVDSNERQVLETEGIFPYIGSDPATTFLSNLDMELNGGYIVVDNAQRSNVKGIYGAGDVCFKQLRQVVTATSDGAMAAQTAFHDLTK